MRLSGLALAALAVLALALPGRAAEGTFNSNGVRLHYAVQGKGPPVVLLHGMTSNSRLNWDLPGVTKALEADYRVITLDLRGHGLSEKPHDAAKYGGETVEDVARLLDHLKVRRAHLVGYSLGGMVAHKFAVKHPDRVLSLTLGGIGWTDGGHELGNHFLAGMLDRRVGTPGGAALPARKVRRPGGRGLAQDQNDPKALAAMLRNQGLGVTEAEMKAVAAPTLVIIGGKDGLKVTVDAMKQKRPAVRVVEIPGAGHITTLGSPIFIKSIKSFLGAQPSVPVEPQ